MKDANSLPYYPRFIFNCSDGKCLSTGDLDFFKHIKEIETDYDITSFVPGRKLEITWATDNEEQEIKAYIINRIEIHQLKYDLDEPTYGINSNDCTAIFGKDKKWLMEIYIFLNLIP